MAEHREDANGEALDQALYVDDRELHRRVAPHLGKDRFRAAILACERRDFPRVNALFRGRYWPAVRQWLDRENGVGSNAPGSTAADDGLETFDAVPRKSARPKRRPVSPGAGEAVALLVREERGAGHDGFPRRLHPAAR
jgi:hypothetical protein